MEGMFISIYRDSTGRFTQEECDENNVFDTCVSYKNLHDYFMEKVRDNLKADEDTSDARLFVDWIDNYTLDETEDLYDYCLNRGEILEEYNRCLRIYSYDIWDGDKGIILAYDWFEAIKIFRENYEGVPIADIEDLDYDSGVCQMDYVGLVDKPKSLYLYN